MTSNEDAVESAPGTANQNVDVGSMLLRDYLKAHKTNHINSVVDQGEEYIKLFRQEAAHFEARTREYYEDVLQSLREKIEQIANMIEASKPIQPEQPTPDERPRKRPQRKRQKKASPVKVEFSPIRPRRTRRKK